MFDPEHNHRHHDPVAFAFLFLLTLLGDRLMLRVVGYAVLIVAVLAAAIGAQAAMHTYNPIVHFFRWIGL